jgi:hypothetical protein
MSLEPSAKSTTHVVCVEAAVTGIPSVVGGACGARISRAPDSVRIIMLEGDDVHDG